MSVTALPSPTGFTQARTTTLTLRDYFRVFADIHTMQNLTFGADGGLMQACQIKHLDEPWLCFMSPHMNDVIDTPFFMFNSKC